MSFLVIVIALLLDQVMRGVERVHPQPWYRAPLADWAKNAVTFAVPVQFLAALLPSFASAFAVGAIAWGLMAANIVLGFIWAVLVLLFALGPHNVGVEIATYLKARAGGDREGAHRSAALIVKAEPPGEPAACARAVIAAAPVRAGDWLFAALFWFMLLGPLGAALYRVAVVTADCAAEDRPGSGYARVAETLARLMAWMPMHLLALTYAIVGGFDQAARAMRDAWRDVSPSMLARGSALAGRAGRAAIHGMTASGANEVELLHAAADLVWRAVLVWLAVIGIIALIEWLT